jgi:predicted nuclease of predicted toxin-antitoxin system
MKLLIDECLSQELVEQARIRGHDASHVTWLGMAGKKDWELMPVIIQGDWTFVTKNSRDFRGSFSSPGDRGLYRKQELHCGLICLNALNMDLDLMKELFDAALSDIAENDQLFNEVLEVSILEHNLDIRRYHLPSAI